MNADERRCLPGKLPKPGLNPCSSVLLNFKFFATHGNSLRAQSSQSSAKFAKRKTGDSFVAFFAILASLRTLRSNPAFTGVGCGSAALCSPVAKPVRMRLPATHADKRVVAASEILIGGTGLRPVQ